jgi:hypothetical protein
MSDKAKFVAIVSRSAGVLARPNAEGVPPQSPGLALATLRTHRRGNWRPGPLRACVTPIRF